MSSAGITSIRWNLLGLCASLIAALTVALSVFSYLTIRADALGDTEANLRSTALNWALTTRAYVEQMERVVRRENALVQQRLTASVDGLIDVLEASGRGGLEEAVEHAAEDRIGRGGYKFIVDRGGRYVLSRDRVRDGRSIVEFADAETTQVISDGLRRARELAHDDFITLTYPWREEGDEKERDQLVVLGYYPALDYVIGAASYFTDFRSDELKITLQEELKQKMADQKIGEHGYLFVLDRQGAYVVSKDRLQDHENMSDILDSNGRKLIPTLIEGATRLEQGETFITRHAWRDIGEPKPLQAMVAIAYDPSWEWIIGAQAYEVDYFSSLKKVSTFIGVVGGGFVLIGLALSYLFARRITQPIERLERAAMSAASGDISWKLEENLEAGHDEIGSLTRSFKKMLSSLRGHIAEITQEADRRKKAEDELAVKNQDLEKMNKFLVGRELKMVELKEQMRKLESKGKK
jgi:HAMP domain-containing protein